MKNCIFFKVTVRIAPQINFCARNTRPVLLISSLFVTIFTGGLEQHCEKPMAKKATHWGNPQELGCRAGQEGKEDPWP